MTPYSSYIKKAQAPGYTSATETAGKAFQPPGYYNRPNIDPQLAAQGKALESEYARAFPYGDYTYSTKGWGYRGSERVGMPQEQIDLRNRFRLYEAQVRGAAPVNPNAVAPSPSAAGAFIGDLARSPVMPTAPFMYGYDVATKGFNQASADKAKSDAVYGSMLADAGKRVANRWGGNFELQYNDPLLDYSSYALEAAPSLLMMAGTAGGSAAAQAGVQGAKSVAPSALRATGQAGVQGAKSVAPSALRATGQALSQGFQPVMQTAASPVVRFAGRSVPSSLNYAIAGVNPVPLLTGAATAGSSWALPFSQLGAHLATQGAARNYANAIRDVQSFNQVNPELAGTPASARRFAESLAAGGISFDPTSLNPYGIGASAFMPGLAQQGSAAIDQAVANRVASLSPEDRALVQENPAALNQIRTEVTNAFNSANPSYSYVSGLAEGTSFNPFRALGARSYSEDLNQDEIAAGTAWAPFAEAFATGKDPMQDPNVQEALAEASPEARQKMQQSLTFRMGSLAPELTGGMLNLPGAAMQDPRLYDALSALQQDPSQVESSPLGRHLMQSPVASLVGGNPEAVVGATAQLANLNVMLSAMHDSYRQTGQAPSGYQELLEGARRLSAAQQNPSSGQVPFTETLAELQPIMSEVYKNMQPAEETSP